MDIFNILDILRLICIDLTDVDFIKFISVSSHLYNLRTHNLKLLTNQYNISKIIEFDLNKMYNFSEIAYDILEWYPKSIPPHVQKITFIDEFNQNISELLQFKYLKCINIGIFYTNNQLLDNDIPDTINKNELIMISIVNKVFVDQLKSDIEKLSDIVSNKEFPIYLNRLSCNAIHRKCYGNMSITELNKQTLASNSLIRKINEYINTNNQYEMKFYCHDLTIATQEYLDFINFYITRMKFNICHLKDKIFKKYNFNDFDDFIIALWGKERVDQHRLDNIARRKARRVNQ